MRKNFAYSVNFNEKIEALFKEAVYLGQGNNGIVYELPGNKVIKIFLNPKVCDDESSILLKTNGSRFFPKIDKKGENYIIRDKVEGERLDYYIKQNGLSYELIDKIYSLLKEFKKLKFKKLDIRCKDILVTDLNEIKIIDPKKSYHRKVDFPRHLMKGLKRLEVLDVFLERIRIIDPKKAYYWESRFAQYLENETYHI